ncbi:winged helix-turn-helix domain-containing protein [Variovorax sp. Sphag1AA]|uniref:ATP-binding protein n=1 Tax=Variovorax sp. Sphag1AA TaxID=2587027 RepID=UPI001614D07B|nr:winged helix-turn-helix domain-containing protein [Variovorax sp. Sphag1AA]MBB3181579.1 putative ATPase/DNA-binding winged helix-turn-helix (wHTH) protein [Variovorax sp. Sphag1AA]
MEPPHTAQAEPTQAPTDTCWRFGSFVLWEAQRRIEQQGEAVRLGSRSFDLLLQLIKRPGEVVSKEDLLATVWAGVVVEEASVRVHMSTLRKALGEPEDAQECKEWISNIPLRGYRFNGRVYREATPPTVADRQVPSDVNFTKLPVRLTRLIGREADVERIHQALGIGRLVTVVGTGGIGKTSVAIRAAECLEQQKASRIAFVDLSPLASGDRVLSTLARALSVTTDMGDTMQAVVMRLAGLDALLLIDNCEHVVDTVAPLVSRLLSELPQLRILATSREAMRVQGEHVLRLSPLAVPDEDDVGFSEAMRAPAVELLVERAAAAGSRVFGESDGSALAKIARQIDGIPLAIELVAARLGVQPIGDLALRLNDHMRLYSMDKRALLARHTTLAATLEWSATLLTPDELKLFRRLSVFRGRFDVESALSVAQSDMDGELAFDALISLANKSLVSFDNNDAIAPYRLLITTRSYAAALLAASDERPAMIRRHAALMLDLMKTARTQLHELGEQAWLGRYAFRLDDVRLAIEMCLTEQLDTKFATSLITASALLWFQVSQVAEYRDWVRATLALVDRQPHPDIETAASLNTALVSALLSTGAPSDESSEACDRALAGALAVKMRIPELHARWGRCTHDMFRGEYLAALRNSEILESVVQSWDDPPALILSHRVSAMANHFCGSFALSRKHSEAALGLSGPFGRTAVTAVVGPEDVVAAKAVLCKTLWLQGQTVKALEAASDAVSRAEATGNSVSLCAALYGSCAVALWSGELELARRWIPRMMEEARRKGLEGWYRYAEWFSQGLQLRLATDPQLHVCGVREKLAGYDAPHKEMLLTFCVNWLDDEIIARIERGEGLWCAAEAWRAAGWREEQRDRLPAAGDFYLRAIDLARQQGALSWELRAVTSLARLGQRLGKRDRAAGRLAEICERAAAAGSEGPELDEARALRLQLTCP